MDWNECIKKIIVKDVHEDKNKVASIKKIANQKIISANYLPEEHCIARITLFYDALREILESIALEEGFKIYNHECYTAFLKEILNKSELGDKFDKIRKIRNGINYYGKNVELEESRIIIKDIKELIEKLLK